MSDFRRKIVLSFVVVKKIENGTNSSLKLYDFAVVEEALKYQVMGSVHGHAQGQRDFSPYQQIVK